MEGAGLHSSRAARAGETQCDHLCCEPPAQSSSRCPALPPVPRTRPVDSNSLLAITRRKRVRRRRANRAASRTPTSARATRVRWPITWSQAATPGGIGYYVGGGLLIGHGQGECRQRDEGTWGWDETGGSHFRRRVILGWSHGRKYQGGTGAYRTDGPVVPDLIYATTSTLNSLGRREREEEHE